MPLHYDALNRLKKLTLRVLLKGYRCSGKSTTRCPLEDLTISSSRIFFRFRHAFHDAYMFLIVIIPLFNGACHTTNEYFRHILSFYRPWAIDACGKAPNVENKGSFAISYHGDITHLAGRSPPEMSPADCLVARWWSLSTYYLAHLSWPVKGKWWG